MWRVFYFVFWPCWENTKTNASDKRIGFIRHLFEIFGNFAWSNCKVGLSGRFARRERRRSIRTVGNVWPPIDLRREKNRRNSFWIRFRGEKRTFGRQNMIIGRLSPAVKSPSVESPTFVSRRYLALRFVVRHRSMKKNDEQNKTQIQNEVFGENHFQIDEIL